MKVAGCRAALYPICTQHNYVRQCL